MIRPYNRTIATNLVQAHDCMRLERKYSDEKSGYYMQLIREEARQIALQRVPLTSAERMASISRKSQHRDSNLDNIDAV